MSTEMKDVFVIPERQGDSDEKIPWPRIGAAFVNKDDSLNVVLDAVPLTGRLHIRDRKFRKEKGENPNRSAAMSR